jgi:calcium-dependent protein kinase
LEFLPEAEENVACRGRFVMQNNGNLHDFYHKELKISASLGSHTFKATNKSTQAVYAVKTVPKSRIRDISRFEQEITIMKQLDHPHVAKLHETVEDSKHVHMVLEYCGGGDLFDRISEAGHLTEVQAAAIMKQLLRACQYLHEKHVCHRDLKPEHVLFVSQEPIESNFLKVIDFANAAKYENGQTFLTKAGTPYYVAPEILRGSCTQAVDLWSCGVILYIMLCGSPPFMGATDYDVLAKIRKGDVQFQPDDWKQVSTSATNLVRQLLEVNVAERCVAKEALKHPWIMRTAPGAGEAQLQPNVVENLRRFREHSQLKKAAIQVVADRLQEDQIKALRTMFLELDTNGDGSLANAEIMMGLQRAGFTQLPHEIQQIVDGIDFDSNGVVDYTEFLAASLDKLIYTQEDACWAAFRVFDRNGDGKISLQEWQQVLNKDTLPVEAPQHYDRDGDGCIDFNEFQRMMHKK